MLKHISLHIAIYCTCLLASSVHAQWSSPQEKLDASELINEIGTNDAYQDGNWTAVLEAVAGKNIVLLGEFTHGAGEVFTARNDLIKQLHATMDFDVILFEAGIGEQIGPNQNKQSLSPEQMTYGFFSIWRTAEFRELMSFIKAEEISFAGFDVQSSGNSFEEVLLSYCQGLNISPRLYSEIESNFNKAQDLVTSRDAEYINIADDVRGVMASYTALSEELSKHISDHSIEDLLIQRTLTNRIAYLDMRLSFVQNQDWTLRWDRRDSMMADNVRWLLEHVYAQKKVLIIAHNFHIAKSNNKLDVMGEVLHKSYGQEMYSIGFYGGSGSYSNNRGIEEQMSPPDSVSLDIQHVVDLVQGRVGFFDIPVREDKYSWLYKEIVANNTFIDLVGSNQLILAQHFDGVVLVDQVSPPLK